jgi:hypothetical protein
MLQSFLKKPQKDYDFQQSRQDCVKLYKNSGYLLAFDLPAKEMKAIYANMNPDSDTYQEACQAFLQHIVEIGPAGETTMFCPEAQTVRVRYENGRFINLDEPEKEEQASNQSFFRRFF